MNRRAALGLLLAPIVVSIGRMARAAVPPGQGAKMTPTFQEQLEKGLKARRPSEFQFIKDVVFLVEVGLLSRKLVDSTFQWARRHRRHAFQYFERALITRARRKGVKLAPATRRVVI